MELNFREQTNKKRQKCKGSCKGGNAKCKKLIWALKSEKLQVCIPTLQPGN